MQDLRVSSLSRFTRWPFCLSALLFLFIMHRGCLATPARRGVIDSHRGPLHNRRTADKGRWGGGQWCISWFWLGIRVLNSHGSPRGTTQGWWEIESGISGYACFFIFLLHLGEQAEGGQKEDTGKRDVSKSESWAKNSRRAPFPGC